MRIVCFHLYNDYSGSPKVLRMVLNEALQRGHQVDLLTSRGGVLDVLKGCPKMKIHGYAYEFSDNKLITTLRYAWVQVYTFFKALGWATKSDAVFYVNTLLPVGPALAGRLMGKRVVYHYHENAHVKGATYRILAKAMQRLAHRIVCVSEYQATFLERKDKVIVIPNALPKAFVERLRVQPESAFERKVVLMLGSLKAYKGTREFVCLAKRMPQYKFVLVLNEQTKRVDHYIGEQGLNDIDNLRVYAKQEDVAEFYNSASLVLNLSDKRSVVETFGLTVLEAMSAGLPVIVPTVGGIAEMVEDGANGYRIDVANLDDISIAIDELLTNKEKYLTMAREALLRAEGYDAETMADKIIRVLDKDCTKKA